MSKKSLGGLIILTIFLLAACKKYPEGGIYRNARKIFNSGKSTTFDVIQFDVNGADSLEAVGGDSEKKSVFVRFFKSGRFNYYQAKGVIGSPEYDFGGDRLIFPDNNGKRNVLNPVARLKMEWKILRCKDGEVVLDGSLDQNNYRLVLKEH